MLSEIQRFIAALHICGPSAEVYEEEGDICICIKSEISEFELSVLKERLNVVIEDYPNGKLAVIAIPKKIMDGISKEDFGN